MNPLQIPSSFDRDPDYLWDRSGPPDSDVAHLEQILSTYRHRARAARLPDPEPLPLPPASIRRASWSPLAAAAMLLLAITAAFMGHRILTTSWQVEVVAGTPTVGSAPLTDSRSLAVGDLVRTDSDSAARLLISDQFNIEVEPGSTVRIAPSAGRQHRLDLRAGAIYARVTAPPKLFVVDTPAARAVDMGCEYRLETDSDGSGSILVILGWVYLEDGGHESRVPMGARCLVRPGRAPGTPFFDDASPEFREALARVDFAGVPRDALSAVLNEARPRDGLSLWHLLSKVSPADRHAVFDRLAALKPLPPTLASRGILSLDQTALDAWFEDMRPF